MNPISLITKGKISFAGTSAPINLDNRIVNLKLNLKKGFPYNMNINTLTPLVKGDTITVEADINTDITNWKIRAELFDNCGHSIKLATANVTGGSADQIEITETGTISTFLIKVPSGSTDNFADKAELEIEVETTNIVAGQPEINTVSKGMIDFLTQQITWTTVT